jgi:hypothetical protein
MRKHKIHSISVDITGEIFNQLTALKYLFSKNNKQYWLFKCECGNEKTARKDRVTSGIVKSCGCQSKDTRFQIIHGIPNKDRTYRSWRRMKTRCLNKNYQDYENYGGRGIKICDRWIDSFENFLNDMGERPLKMTLDRIDVNGNYEPKNCRWATHEQQCNNTRNNVFIIWNGRTQTIMQWAKELNIPYARIRYFNKKGQTLEEIIANYNQNPELYEKIK